MILDVSFGFNKLDGVPEENTCHGQGLLDRSGAVVGQRVRCRDKPSKGEIFPKLISIFGPKRDKAAQGERQVSGPSNRYDNASVKVN